MRLRPAVRREAVLWAGTASFALLAALYVTRPLHAAAVDYDSTASVLYFQRIVSGQRLEEALSATPKPLLTAIFGALFGIFHDWRPLVWATLGAYAAGIGGASVIARRMAGLAAGIFVCVGLVGSGALLIDASRAYAVSWALLGWVVAGVALTRPRPKYAIAGVALLLASLARVETLVLVFVAAVALAVAALVARRRGTSPPPRDAAFILIATLALPIMMLHDWLLAGDPFFWIHVSERFSVSAADAIKSQTPGYMLAWVLKLFAGYGLMAALAVLGFVGLVIRRQTTVALGLLTLGPGIAAFLVFLAARHTYVSTRYAIPIEIATIVAAGIGLGSLRVPVVRAPVRRYVRGRLPRGRRLPAVVALVVVTAGVTAMVASKEFGPFDKQTVGLIGSELHQAQNADLVVPVIRRTLAGHPERTDASAILVVPGLQQPRFAVATGLPLKAINATVEAGAASSLVSVPGRLIFHDSRGDTKGSMDAFEATSPMTVDGVTLRLLASDEERGYWLWQVQAPPSGLADPGDRSATRL
jgi:hypothetical protein